MQWGIGATRQIRKEAADTDCFMCRGPTGPELATVDKMTRLIFEGPTA